MQSLNDIKWEHMPLSKALDIINNNKNNEDFIIIFNPDKLSQATKEMLGIEKED